MRKFIQAAVLLSCLSLAVVSSPVFSALGGTVVSVDVTETTGVADTNAPVTLGHVFAVGDVSAGVTLAGRNSAGDLVPLQAGILSCH